MLTLVTLELEVEEPSLEGEEELEEEDNDDQWRGRRWKS